MATNRQQVADLQQAERLQPTSSPTQSFVQPRSADSAGGVAGFFKALAPLSSTLDQYANRLAADERETNEAAAERKIGGMTFDEARAAVKAGDMQEFSNPWFRAAFEKSYGIRAGNEVRRQAEEEMATADFTTEDPEAYVSGKMRAAAEELPQGKFAQSGFVQATNGLVDKVRDKVNEDRTAKTVEERTNVVTHNTQSAVDQAIEAKVTPDQLLKLVRDQYQPNRDLLGVSYKTQDTILAGVIKTLAQRPGTKAYIEALGRLDRDGVSIRDKLGPTFETALDNANAETTRDQVEADARDVSDWTLRSRTGDPSQFDEKTFNAWVDQQPTREHLRAPLLQAFRNEQEQQRREAEAKKEREDRRRLAQMDAQAKDAKLAELTPGLADLARTGHVAEIAADRELAKPSGEGTFTLTAKELKETALRAAATQIETEGAQQRLPPEVVRDNVVRMYGSNGEVDPLVQSRVSAFLNATVNPGDIPQTSLDYLPELTRTMKVAPHMVERVASSDKDRLFLNTMETGMDYGLAPQEAIRNAVFRRDNADKLSPMPGKDRAALTQKAIKDLSGQGGFWSSGNNTVQNTAMVQNLVEDRLAYYYATGASGEDLKKRVVESVGRTHTYLNGHLIDITGTGVSAAQAEPILKEAAENVAKTKPEFGKLGITFIPLGTRSDRFQAVTKDGTPVRGTERTWAEMSAFYSKKRAERLMRGTGPKPEAPHPASYLGG